METILNIRVDILEQIAGASQPNGISCSEMIVLLIEKVMADITGPDRIGRMVNYRDKCRPDEWHVFHVHIREDVYGYWLDLRKLL
jgi:hypothetical protein